MKASNLIMLFVASCTAISANAPDYSTMLVAPMEVTAPAVPTVSLNGHCEKVGEYRCIDGYKIMECGTSNKWEQRICPGGCDSDATFAHCLMPKLEAASIAGRNDAQCTPKSRACDSARRFVFECNDDGHWNEGNQCNRAGACNVSGEWGLVCTGHPRFYYDDNRVCERERSCELMAYKNCLAVSLAAMVIPFPVCS